MSDIYFSKDKNKKNINSYDPDSDTMEIPDIDEFLDDHQESLGKGRKAVAKSPSAVGKIKPANSFRNAMSRVRKASKSSSKGSLALKIVAAVLALLIIAGGATGLYLYKSILGEIQYEKEEDHSNKYVKDSELIGSKDVKNILLIGLDSDSTEDVARSDSMILVSIDSKNKAIKLTSFLRDMWVEIPGKKTAKLNAAASSGGPNLVMDTIEYNFKIKIDNYVMIGFDAFQKIIDAVGGIEVDVSKAEAKEMANFGCVVTAGTNVHLNGEQALWFARVRKMDSDFQRTSRQRLVIEKAFAKAKKLGVGKLLELANQIAPLVSTDLDKSELLKLGANGVVKYLGYSIMQGSVPAKGTWSDAKISGQAVLKVDFKKNIDYLKEFIYENKPEAKK
ncbi:MAG: LCP family protein [Clostridiales bacterium]|jgi:LCP family protein required for cell wall assembly|nr:LCP family protein [Clostridiales bacterium]